jgi:hypothetical protein
MQYIYRYIEKGQVVLKNPGVNKLRLIFSSQISKPTNSFNVNINFFTINSHSKYNRYPSSSLPMRLYEHKHNWSTGIGARSATCGGVWQLSQCPAVLRAGRRVIFHGLRTIIPWPPGFTEWRQPNNYALCQELTIHLSWSGDWRMLVRQSLPPHDR